MSQWFRMYVEVLDDPKVQNLNSADFKFWVNLLCFAAKSNGILPNVDAISFALRIPKQIANKRLKILQSNGLLDCDQSANSFKPHNWNKRQFKSDVSSDRVKRFRERFNTVSETVSETAPLNPPHIPPHTPPYTPPYIPSETETEKELPPNGGCPQNPSEEVFEYWRRFDVLIRHRALTNKIRMHVNARLREGYTLEDIKRAVSRYAELVVIKHNGKTPAPGYGKWGLEELLSRNGGGYIDKLCDPTWQGFEDQTKRVRSREERLKEMQEFEAKTNRDT